MERNQKNVREQNLGLNDGAVAILDQDSDQGTPVSAARLSGLSANYASQDPRKCLTALVGSPSAKPADVQVIATKHTPGTTNVGAIFQGPIVAKKGRRILAILDCSDIEEANSRITNALLTKAIGSMTATRSESNVLAFAAEVAAFAFVGYWNEQANRLSPLLRIELPSQFVEAVKKATDGKQFTTQAWAEAINDETGNMLGAAYVLGTRLYVDPIDRLEASITHALQTGAPSFTRLTVPVSRLSKKGAKGSERKAQRLASAFLAKTFPHLLRSASKVYRTKNGHQVLFVTDVLGNTWPVDITPALTGGQATIIDSAFKVEKGIGDPIGYVDSGVEAMEQELQAYMRRLNDGFVEVHFRPMSEAFKAILDKADRSVANAGGSGTTGYANDGSRS